MAATVIFDDCDPAIAYSGGWGKAGVIEEFKNMTSFTWSSGATANLTFSGTEVRVIGTISNVGRVSVSSYSINGGTTAIFNATMQQTIQYQQLFFQSNGLTPASHTLVITTLSGGAAFFLDYIEVTPFITATPSSTLSGASTLATVPLGTTSAVTSSKAGLPLGPIIGGALGGLPFLIFAFILFRRRSNNRSHYGELTNSSLWTSIPMVPAQNALSGQRTSKNVSTPSSNTSQVDAVHQGFHAHGGSLLSQSNPATSSTSTIGQASDSTTIPLGLSPPPYQA